MDAHRFDSLARSLTTGTRRGVLLATLGAAIGTLELASVDAKKKKPCPPCKKRKKGKCKGTLPEGTPCTTGTCQNGRCMASVTPPAGPTCTDGLRNGNETDIDCGGTCPRCGTQKTCASRNDCASALCASTCQQCANAGDCGTDTNGEMCACRDHASGQRFCTKLNAPPGRVFPAGTACTVCQGGEQCFPINGGAGGIECIRPCGA